MKMRQPASSEAEHGKGWKEKVGAPLYGILGTESVQEPRARILCAGQHRYRDFQQFGRTGLTDVQPINEITSLGKTGVINSPVMVGAAQMALPRHMGSRRAIDQVTSLQKHPGIGLVE